MVSRQFRRHFAGYYVKIGITLTLTAYEIDFFNLSIYADLFLLCIENTLALRASLKSFVGSIP